MIPMLAELMFFWSHLNHVFVGRPLCLMLQDAIHANEIFFENTYLRF